MLGPRFVMLSLPTALRCAPLLKRCLIHAASLCEMVSRSDVDVAGRRVDQGGLLGIEHVESPFHISRYGPLIVAAILAASALVISSTPRPRHGPPSRANFQGVP